MKKQTNRQRPSAKQSSSAWTWMPFVAGIVYFFLICLGSPSTIKTTTALLFLPLAAAMICLFVYRDRLSAPVLVLALMTAMGGASTLYAVSGKFAINEFSKVLLAFVLVLILLGFCRGKDPGRDMAQVLAVYSALAGLVSIDLISTRFLSNAALGFIGLFSQDYTNLSGLESGVRMTSLFDNPNFFAGVIGLGVLLLLALVASDAPGPRRAVNACLLFVNALAFVLAFSMGASAAIALAFVAFLVLEVPQRRSGLLVLMVETLMLTAPAVALISATSLSKWTAPRPVPLLCAILGAAGLCLLDRYVGVKLAGKLKGKVILAVAAGVVCVLAVYVVAALSWTGSAVVDPGRTLRRAVYPQAGAYTLDVQGGDGLQVRVESQNQQETMMHTFTVLYQGDLADAAFAVPEDSLVVYFNFSNKTDAKVHLDAAVCHGGDGDYDIPLRYPLLPGFIANRLQGLKANENAIQRLVFFADGMKLFRRSPVVGLGMGAFENGIRSVQSFDYETKYAHNHYIQTLVETGVVGLVLFVGLLAVSAAAVLLARRKKDEDGQAQCHFLIPALGGALVFVAVHAATEVVFSTYPYLPIAYGVFALIGLCCGGVFGTKQLGKKGEIICLSGITVLLVATGFALLLNVSTSNSVKAKQEAGTLSMDDLLVAAQDDPYEWADYALSYVNSAAQMDPLPPTTQLHADRLAKRLAKVDSNTIPIYLAEYYYRTQRPQDGFAMIEKYLNYVSSHAEAWQSAFAIMEAYDDGTAGYAQGVAKVGRMLETWNRENMGTITLDESGQAYLDRIAAKTAS